MSSIMKKHLISFTALLFALTTMPGFVAIGAPEYSGLGTCDQMSNEALSCSIERMRMITNTTKCAGKNNLSTLQNYADIQFRNKAKQDGIDTLTSKDKDLKKFIEKHKNNVLTAVKEYCGKFIIPSSSKSSTTATAQTNKCEGNLIWVESMNACQSPNVAKANLEFDKKLKECQDGGATGYSQTKGCLCPDEKTQEWNGKKCVQKCPWDATGTYPNCNCNSGVHEVPTNSSSHYIQYNSKEGRNQCDEWIELLDSDCIHKGHAPEIRNYNNQNIPQKGKCLVFGDTEETRIQVRTLVRNYNNEIKKKRALPTGTNNAIVFGNKSEVYKWEGLDGKEGQPSIKAIVRGYTALCKRNGDGFNFVRVEQGNTTSYVCQGKKQEDAKSTTSQQTEQKQTSSTKTSSGNKTTAVDAGGADTINVTDAKTGQLVSYKVQTVNATTGQPSKTITDILRSLATTYNQNYKTYGPGSSVLLPLGNTEFKWDSKWTKTLQKEPAFNAISDGYGYLCNMHTQTTSTTGISEMDFNMAGHQGICNIKKCDSNNYQEQPKSNKCIPLNSTSSTSSSTTVVPQTTVQTNIESANDVVKRINANVKQGVRINNQITYPDLNKYTPKERINITQTVDKWIAKCKQAIKAAGGNENEEITPVFDGTKNTLTCHITKCADEQATLTNGKCVLPQANAPVEPVVSPAEPVTEPKWEPDFAPAELGNHIEFSQEHANDPIVIDWIANANNAIKNADGTNKVVQETTPNGQIKYTCIITTCKNGKAPVAGGTACPETIDSLKAETQGLNVASGPSANVELKQPLVVAPVSNEEGEQDCLALHPTDVSARACCEAVKSGVADFIAPTNSCKCKDITKEWNGTACVLKPIAAPVPNEDGEQESQENICDDQNDEIEYLIEEMATPKTDENGNKYIEYSIKYTTCDVLETKWSEHCADNETAKVTRNAEKVILTCEPNQESNDEQDIETIINAFKDRAKQIKDRECNSQG